MRKVPGATPGTIETLTPTSFGNREESDPVEIDFRVPTEQEKRNAKSVFKRAAFLVDPNTRKPEMVDGKMKIIFDANEESEIKYILENFVTAVRNYMAADGKPIEDSARLLVHGETEIVTEAKQFGRALFGLDDQEKKVSSEQLGSKPVEIRPSNGTAESASERGSTFSADAA